MSENTMDSMADQMEPEGEGLAGFEKKYKTQMRQIVTQKIDLPISTLPAMLMDQIKIDPEFQRRDRWDEPRQSRLIESLIMNVPIPAVFLGEDQYGHYVVLDGRQRLTAIKEFLDNSLALQGLEVWDDLNGMRFNDLVKRGIDKHLTRRFISAIALLKESSEVIKYDVFDRLNTGGVKANEMEVRNAVFRGKFTESLHKLSRVPEFCEAWEIPLDPLAAQENLMYQKMEDLTIVLRFFALSEPDKIELPFKDHLSAFMKERNEIYESMPAVQAEDEVRFKRAAANSLKIFGGNAFRNVTKKATGIRSMPIADAVMIALGDFPESAVTEDRTQRLRDKFAELCADDKFVKAVSSGTNGKGAIRTRISMARTAFSQVISNK